jgi:hypothetical protein
MGPLMGSEFAGLLVSKTIKTALNTIMAIVADKPKSFRFFTFFSCFSLFSVSRIFQHICLRRCDGGVLSVGCFPCLGFMLKCNA